tara:strand:+ start:1043 stop:1165 length:123 start_codon:yes stop_codon:yes gene_type:complete
MAAFGDLNRASVTVSRPDRERGSGAAEMDTPVDPFEANRS